MMVAAEAVTTLLRRVRDPQGSQHSPTTVLRLLTEAQRTLNTLYSDVTESADLDVQPRVMHLPLSAAFPRAIRLLSVRTFGGSRDLTELPDWRQLATLDRRWFRRQGDRHLVWAPVGRDAFVIWPGVERIVTITAIYARMTDDLRLDSTIELDNGLHPLLFDLVEGMLLLRGRMFAPLTAVLERLKAGFTAKRAPRGLSA
jgi:hypothetical protein